MAGAMKLMILLLILFNFTFHASFAHLDNNLDSGNLQEKVRETETNESDVSTVRKFAHAGARGGGGGGGEGSHSAGEGGRSAGQGGNGNGGAVIPVYTAAGAGAAASQRKNHHGAAGLSQYRCPKDRLLIIVATTSISFLLHIPM